uniref:Uncharacterized protein n=1 Tax=Cucumis melo TaxID=3656 RepID=A0A9I9E826_CUCME
MEYFVWLKSQGNGKGRGKLASDREGSVTCHMETQFCFRVYVSITNNQLYACDHPYPLPNHYQCIPGPHNYKNRIVHVITYHTVDVSKNSLCYLQISGHQALRPSWAKQAIKLKLKDLSEHFDVSLEAPGLLMLRVVGQELS